MPKDSSKKVVRFIKEPGRRGKIVKRLANRQLEELKKELNTLKKQKDDIQRQLSSTKARLDAIRSISVNPFAIKDIDRTCPFCSKNEITHISSYPGHETPFFAKLMVGWCTHCGGGYVYNLPISLDEYYKKIYARENRKGDRDASPAEYFSDQNPMWKNKNNKYLKRVDNHLQTITEYIKKPNSILDYGSGPGYLLWRSNAKHKYAVEPDENSAKYLDYLGAHKVDINNLPKRIDCIVASHALEHIEYQDLDLVIDKLHSALSKTGIFLIEVPPGALLQKRYEYLHEPHTLFYSKKAMVLLMERKGFTLDKFYTVSKGVEAEVIEPKIIADEEQEEINTSMVFVFKKRHNSQNRAKSK